MSGSRAMAIWKLTIEDDEGQKTVVPLVRDEYTIGRREGHTIRLTERNVSRDHARIRKDPKDDAAYLLEDLGSYNGVFVNGHRVAEPTKLATGDLILIGDYRIEAHNEDAQKAVSVAPPKSVSAPPVAKPREPAPEKSYPHRLVQLTPGDGGGREFPLDKPTMIVGRGEEVDIRVNHSSVSRQHCELHTVDQEHFEVVDSGSANGIRVNGQEVKKALLAPGDTLELGDIQLKYIAAGQAFTYDAAAAEAARASSRSGKKGGATWAILLVLVAGAAIAGILFAKSSNGPDTPANASTGSTSTAANPDEAILAKAYKQKTDGDAIGAHGLVRSFGKESPLRKDKRYVEIENAWADKTIGGVKAETDVEKKKDALKEVLNSGADESYRTTASDMLGELDAKPTPTTTDTVAPEPTEPPPVPTNTAKPQPTATATAKPTATATATVKPTATATATTAPTGGNKCSPYKGDYTAAMRAKEYDCVKSMLLPRLNNGAISQPEARYLKAACQALGDTACEKRAAEKL